MVYIFVFVLYISLMIVMNRINIQNKKSQDIENEILHLLQTHYIHLFIPAPTPPRLHRLKRPLILRLPQPLLTNTLTNQLLLTTSHLPLLLSIFGINRLRSIVMMMMMITLLLDGIVKLLLIGGLLWCHYRHEDLVA